MIFPYQGDFFHIFHDFPDFSLMVGSLCKSIANTLELVISWSNPLILSSDNGVLLSHKALAQIITDLTERVFIWMKFN